jgi:tripartite-type tricarboxylate transporter receptor subunit TctC
VLSGEAHLIFVTVPTTLSFIKTGKIRVVAVTSAQRSPALPDTPTISETILPGFAVNEWHGVLAPAGTPKNAIAAVNRELNRVVALPEVKERLAALGADARGSTPEQMAAFVRTEVERWKKVLKPVD